MKRVIFFNHWHYGDLHVSRGLVQELVKYLNSKNIECVYAHNNHNIFAGLINENKSLLSGLDKWQPFVKDGDDVYFNTWYGTKHRAFIQKETLSFSCLYSLFEYNCKHALGLKLTDVRKNPQDFYPYIDYDRYKIDGVNKFMDEHKNAIKVLVCNGDVKSVQAKNFDMWPSIRKLANKYKNVLWLVTNKNIKSRGNIIYTPNIINKKGTDLNENSYISTFCDLIVGRFSGPHTFSYTKDNLFNSDKTFISFYRYGKHKVIPSTDWIGNRFRGKIKYSAKIVDSASNVTPNVVRDINKQLVLIIRNKK